MIETKPPCNHPKKRQILQIALIFMMSLQLMGCIVGYKTFKTDALNSNQPRENLPDVKISYGDKISICSGKSDCHDDSYPTLLRISLERTLRTNFHILDIEQIPRDSFQRNEPNHFLILTKESPEAPGVGLAWALISIVSFATIPAFWDFDYSFEFTIITPGGEEKPFRYHYTERIYSWLPFVFFGPPVYMSLTSHIDSTQQDRLKGYDEMITRLMTDATPFILSHKASPGP